MTTPIADATVYSDLSGLTALKRDARAADPNALREVARQFESIFAKMMLSSMRQASFGDPVFGSDQSKFYQGMFDDQLSLELTRGRGLGLADLLVRQLQGTMGGAQGVSGAEDAKSAELKIPGRGPASAASLDLTRSAATPPSTPTQIVPFLSEPDAFDPSAALHVANQFIEKMLSGNALANGETRFRTPNSPEDFVKQLWPCAEEAGRELGIDPRNLLAQAALETGWGKSLPCDASGNPSFNFFGIKAGGDWSGNSVSVRTLEFEDGIPVPRQARFRAYDSAAESFRDYVALLRDNPRYAAALNTGSDSKAFAAALQRGGYATDPAYAQKISSIAQNLGKNAMPLKSGDTQPIPSAPDTL